MRATATLRALLLAAAGLSWASALAAEPQLIERVLAVVNGTPILLSDVRLVERLKRCSFAEALELSIDERLMYEEAVRLGPSGLGPAEEQAAFAGLAATWPEASEAEQASLRRSARCQASVLKYIELRFRPQIQAAARRASADKTPSRQPAGAEREDQQQAPAEAERSEREALDQRVEDWVRELRSAAQIRRVEP